MSDLIALKGYTPPDNSNPPLKDLTQIEKDKIKARVRTILSGKAMAKWELVHRATAHARYYDNIDEVKAIHIRQILEEMKGEDEFEVGYGGVISQ
jgi:hypothetical protein